MIPKPPINYKEPTDHKYAIGFGLEVLGIGGIATCTYYNLIFPGGLAFALIYIGGRHMVNKSLKESILNNEEISDKLISP